VSSDASAPTRGADTDAEEHSDDEYGELIETLDTAIEEAC
jgi:hypothetical protein